MQVGDLVTYWHQRGRWLKGEITNASHTTGPQSVHVGLVVETGKYSGNRDVKVWWKPIGRRGGETLTESSQHLSIVDDSLTSS